jgi:hypothetical protein
MDLFIKEAMAMTEKVKETKKNAKRGEKGRRLISEIFLNKFLPKMKQFPLVAFLSILFHLVYASQVHYCKCECGNHTISAIPECSQCTVTFCTQQPICNGTSTVQKVQCFGALNRDIITDSLITILMRNRTRLAKRPGHGHSVPEQYRCIGCVCPD